MIRGRRPRSSDQIMLKAIRLRALSPIGRSRPIEERVEA